jgi:hypothetical protein
MAKSKSLLPEDYSHNAELAFSDERWGIVLAHLPKELDPDAGDRLRDRITACCSWFLAQRALFREGQQTAAALRSSGKRQLALFERVAQGLRDAADAWRDIEQIHDDRLGDLSRYDDLEKLAQDAERRLASFGKLKLVTDPWPAFVCKVARCCREAGLNPTVTGRVYDSSWGTEPTWFQEFMASLNEDLLGDQGRGEQLRRSRAAFYAEVAKALRGDSKPGKARK